MDEDGFGQVDPHLLQSFASSAIPDIERKRSKKAQRKADMKARRKAARASRENGQDGSGAANGTAAPASSANGVASSTKAASNQKPKRPAVVAADDDRDQPGSRQKKKQAKRAAEDEEDYEKQPRRPATWQDEDEEEEKAAAKQARLPVKVNNRLERPPEHKVDETAVDAAPPANPFANSKGFPAKRSNGTDDRRQEESEDSDDEDVVDDVQPANYSTLQRGVAVVDAANPLEAEIRREKRLTELKIEMARVAADIMEMPEERYGRLKILNSYCECEEPGVANTVKRLAFISAATVYKDIIPGYHIRALTEAEQAAPVTKDVRRVRTFEQGLLTGYQGYLKILHDHLKKWTEGAGRNRRGRMDTSELSAPERAAFVLASTATRCMCDLLTGVTHFNFRNNIIDVLTPLMTGRFSRDLAEMTQIAVRTVFKEDQDFEASHQLVKSMCSVIKANQYHVEPAMVACFSTLKIQPQHLKQKKEALGEERNKERLSTVKNAVPGSKAYYASRKQSKIRKATKQLGKELEELDTNAIASKLAHYQTTILSQVFAIYFRVLKFTQRSPLLETALEGLGRFAHLIDASFFSDLFAVLEALAEDPSVDLRAALSCIRTAFVVLSGEGAVLTLDAKRFHAALFRRMLDVPFQPEHFHLVVICVYAMFIKQHEVSLERVAAFFKRLLGISLHLEHHNASACLALMRELLRAYPRLISMLENDLIATGVFHPLMEIPEHANALASTVWEIQPLMRHYHPYVTIHARHVLSGAPVTGTTATNNVHANTLPLDVLRRTHPQNGGLVFNPPMQMTQSLSKGKKSHLREASSLQALVPETLAWPVEAVRHQFRRRRAAELIQEKAEYDAILSLYQETHATPTEEERPKAKKSKQTAANGSAIRPKKGGRKLAGR